MKKYFNLNLILITLLVIFSLGNLIFELRTNNYFSVDDFFVLAYLKEHNLLQMVVEFITRGDIFGFRKVIGYLFFGMLFKTFGTNALAFNVFIFVLHTFNLIILYLITVHLSKNKLSSFLISVIFNKYFMFYFSNIHEYSLVLFSLLTIYLFLKVPKKNYLYISTFILALLSKETAFGLPFVLYSLSIIQNLKKSNLRIIFPLFIISILFIAYQSLSLFTGKTLNVNNSYLLVNNVTSLAKNLLFYFDWKLLLLSIVLPLLTKKYRYLSLFFVAIITIIPASVLQNRRELYYLYLPISYLLIYLSLFLQKTNFKTALLCVILIFLFGGRSILPSIAWKSFPNWQKISMENVLKRIIDQVNSEKDIYVGDINVERDARLMLETRTTDLFLSKEIGSKYNFIYDSTSAKIIVVSK